jgi:hypothetical protein
MPQRKSGSRLRASGDVFDKNQKTLNKPAKETKEPKTVRERILSPKEPKSIREPAAAPAERIVIPEIEIGRLNVRLIGDSPLIMHKWSAKAKKEMLDKQMKRPKQAKEAKDPEADVLGCIYRDGEGHVAFPSIAFKSAVVDACRFTDGMKMTVLRGAFHVDGEFVRIESAEQIPREDMVRVGMGVADIRFRPEFREWKATVRLTYNSRAISAAEIINLFNLAGFGVGIGEWRPEKNGQFGRFHVAREGEEK